MSTKSRALIAAFLMTAVSAPTVATAQQKPAAAAAVGATLADMDTSMLTETEKQSIDSFVDKINVENPDHVLLYGTSKAERRAVVSKDHQIVLLLGDTLHDFDGVFRKAPTDVKRAEVDKNAAHFGADWIVFPNATYGDWSTAPLTAWDAELVVK